MGKRVYKRFNHEENGGRGSRFITTLENREIDKISSTNNKTKREEVKVSRDKGTFWVLKLHVGEGRNVCPFLCLKNTTTIVNTGMAIRKMQSALHILP